MIEVVDFFFQTVDDVAGILSPEHQYNSLDQVMLILKSYLAQPGLGRNLHLSNVLDQDRRTSPYLDQDVFDILNTFQKTDPSDYISLGSFFDNIPAHVDVG